MHNVTLADAKELLRAGVEGWLHVPVREGDVVDDEIIGIVRDRIVRGDKPWITLSLHHPVDEHCGRHAAAPGSTSRCCEQPIRREQIEKYWDEPLKKMSPEALARVRKNLETDGSNAMKLRAAGMRVVGGTDTGQTRFLIGYFNHLDLESMVAIGMTPLEAIKAATYDGAEIGHFDTGLVAPGKSADFIVLDANPLESIANTRKIAKVYLRGQEVPRAELAAKWQSAFGQATTR